MITSKFIKSNTKFFYNIISLYSLHAINALFPVIILPLIISALGIELFGRLSFLSGVAVFFGAFVAFGLDTSATRDLSERKVSSLSIETYICTAFYARLLIFSLVVFLGGVAAYFFSEDPFLMFMLIISASLQSLFPLWLFQGLGQFRWLPLLSFINKSSSFFIILFSVKEEGDIILVPIAYSIGSLVSFIVSIFIARKFIAINPTPVKLRDIISYLYSKFSLFASSFFSTLYRSGLVVIVGYVAGDTQAGIYAAAERLVKVMQVGINTVGLAIFPSFTSDIKRGRIKFREFNSKWGMKVFISLFIILLLFNFSAFFFFTYFNSFLSEVSLITLHVMSLVLLFGGMNYYYGYLGLLSSGRDSEFSKMVIYTGLIGVFTSIFFCKFFGAVGGAFSFSLAELLLMLALHHSTTKSKT